MKSLPKPVTGAEAAERARMGAAAAERARMASEGAGRIEEDRVRRIREATLSSPFVNGLGMRFVPAGSPGVLFSVGDVRVSDYRKYVAEGGGAASGNPGFKQGEDHPAVCVSWVDAKGFCRWLTQRERADKKIGPDMEYRLPRDTEWTRAAGEGKYPWGADWPPPKRGGNYESAADGFLNTSPVGAFHSNRYGLADMGGNVWQWCEEWSNASQKQKVLRGASWRADSAELAQISSRRFCEPAGRLDDQGFRCVLDFSKSK